jgi:hypothetical protein
VLVAGGSRVPASQGQAPLAGPFAELASPAPAGSAQPNLAAGPDGTIWLSWLETRAEGGHRLRLSRLAADRWSQPVTLAEGTSFFANWADFPSVFVTRDGTLAVHWLERSGQGTYAYGVRVRTSRDGRAWTDTIVPHSDASPTEHGFVSFFDDPKTGLGLIWLDGREMTGGHEGHGSMTVRSASIRNGQAVDEQLVDARVCECCQTAAASTSEGAIVAYRDRSDTEVRDMSVSRLVDGRWTPPATVHADQWQVNACPVNGPSIAALGRHVAVAWFTGAGGTRRTQAAFSSDAGASFGAPIVFGAGETMGRVGLVMPDADRALVSSLERRAEGGRLVLRQVRRDGSVSDAVDISPMGIERASGFARLALDGRGRLLVAWTDTARGSPSRVHVAAARLR